MAKGLRKGKATEAKKEAEVQEKIDAEVVETQSELNEEATKLEEKAGEEAVEVVNKADLAEKDVNVSAVQDEEDQKQLEKDLNVPEVKVSTAKTGNARIKPSRDIRTYIGDRWYNLKADKVETVPAEVKEILNRAGALKPL
jgi:hypothetical protein